MKGPDTLAGAKVLLWSDHQAVFALPVPAGVSVFLATRGREPRTSLSQVFEQADDAERYARQLADRFGCQIIRAVGTMASGEDAA